jgi:K+-transporting ATPase A subunit
MFSGMVGLSLTAILILGAALAARISSTAFRYVFWLAMGLRLRHDLEWGIMAMLAVIAALVAVCLLRQGRPEDAAHVMKMSLVDGAKQALPVGVACASSASSSAS